MAALAPDRTFAAAHPAGEAVATLGFSRVEEAIAATRRTAAAVALADESRYMPSMAPHTVMWEPVFAVCAVGAMCIGYHRGSMRLWKGTGESTSSYERGCEWVLLRKLSRLANVAGPGLMVCLADSDIGGLFTMAEAGSKTGFTLISLQLFLIPVLYVVQEMVVRLSVCRKAGLVALANQELGTFHGGILGVVMVLLGVFAMMSEFSGIVAVGELFGLSALQSCSAAVMLLTAVILSGDYGRVERVGLGLGACLCVFLVTMVLCNPPWGTLMWSVVHPNYQAIPASAKLHEIVLANIGTVVTPWMLFYQASAVVEKRLVVADLQMARLDTLIGSIITQIVMASVLVTFAVQARGVDLNGLVMGEVFIVPLQPLLGKACTRLLVACGLLGSSLLATLVISLGVAWNLTEVCGGATHAGAATKSPLFRMFYLGSLVLSATVVSSEFIGIMRLNILVQLLNGVLMPLVVGYVYYLAVNPQTLPYQHRVRGIYGAVVGLTLLVCCGLALWLAVSSIITGSI